MFCSLLFYSVPLCAEDGYIYHNPLVVDCNLAPPVLAGEAPQPGCGCADCPRACTLNLPEFQDFRYDFYIVQGVDGLVFIMIIGMKMQSIN
jgi:hypothetical protein